MRKKLLRCSLTLNRKPKKQHKFHLLPISQNQDKRTMRCRANLLAQQLMTEMSVCPSLVAPRLLSARLFPLYRSAIFCSASNRSASASTLCHLSNNYQPAWLSRKQLCLRTQGMKITQAANTVSLAIERRLALSNFTLRRNDRHLGALSDCQNRLHMLTRFYSILQTS